MNHSEYHKTKDGRWVVTDEYTPDKTYFDLECHARLDVKLWNDYFPEDVPMLGKEGNKVSLWLMMIVIMNERGMEV